MLTVKLWKKKCSIRVSRSEKDSILRPNVGKKVQFSVTFDCRKGSVLRVNFCIKKMSHIPKNFNSESNCKKSSSSLSHIFFFWKQRAQFFEFFFWENSSSRWVLVEKYQFFESYLESVQILWPVVKFEKFNTLSRNQKEGVQCSQSRNYEKKGSILWVVVRRIQFFE